MREVAYEALEGLVTSVILNAPEEYANTQTDTALANAENVGYTGDETVRQDTKSRYSYDYSGTPEHITDVAATLPPTYEDLLSNGWEDISVPGEAASGHYRLIEHDTGLQIRFDRKVEGAPGFHGKNHYHILNPNAGGKRDKYIDADGNPVSKGSVASHIVAEER